MKKLAWWGGSIAAILAMVGLTWLILSLSFSAEKVIAKKTVDWILTPATAITVMICLFVFSIVVAANRAVKRRSQKEAEKENEEETDPANTGTMTGTGSPASQSSTPPPPPPTSPLKKRLLWRIGMVALGLLLITSAGFGVYRYFHPTEKYDLRRNETEASTTSKPSPTRRAQVYTEADADPEVLQIAKEELVDQPDLLQRLTEESGGLRHWEDNKPHTKNNVLRGPGGIAVGVAQINEQANQEFCHEYDIYDVRGNLRCAKLLYLERGLQPWYTDPASPNIIEFNVRVRDSHSPVLVTGKIPCNFSFDKTVDIKTADNWLDPADPRHVDVPETKLVSFRVKGGGESTGHFTCKTRDY